MSEQSDALNKLARERGVIAGGADDGPPIGILRDGEGEDGERPDLPKVKLPRDGHLASAFFREVGGILKRNGVFRIQRQAVTVDQESGQILSMDAHRFRSYVENHMVCYVERQLGKNAGYHRINQTMAVEDATSCLRSDAFVDQQRPLARVNKVRLPVMRADGRIELLPEGYDEESQIYTLPGGVDYDETMTAEGARKYIEWLLSEFPFGDVKQPSPETNAAGTVGLSRSKAVWLAAAMSQFAFHLIPLLAPRPGFIFNSNSQRSGKDLLLRAALTPTWGLVSDKPWPSNEEAMILTLETALKSKSPYIYFDNIPDGWKICGGALEGFMTTSVRKVRLFHTQDEYEMPRTSMLFFTGNNLEWSADIAGRCLVCDLFVPEANAQTREIKHVVDEHYFAEPEVRRDMLSALWAFVRHWDARRRPAEIRKLRGFEKWSQVFGGIVQAAGFGDPLEQRSVEQGYGDSEFADMLVLVTALAKDMEGARGEYDFQQIVDRCRALSCFEHLIDGKEKDGVFEPSPATRSKLPKRILDGKFGGRTFVLDDGRRVKFGQHGKNRSRKYVVEVVG